MLSNGMLPKLRWNIHFRKRGAAIFVDVAEGLEIQSILHTNHRSTSSRRADFGLRSNSPAQWAYLHEIPGDTQKAG
jgi:hypothetical protein